ncbi:MULTISPECIES: hypothetical protein [Clostridium]|uniref:hypothetical protein n=1 Tax=Clostridium TaxID=1485 RepID=UPI001D2B1AA3|nr:MULTISPECIES: hypothetical protein [Clostridium]MBS5308814.1 hypothetical protein [Clostridium sp.]MDB1933122.1 hypothetical protein [Clostridium tertium]MDB1938189.1 hypothetical protein [Clostridium tertium]MDB1944120.1 hypothetical protein [Clostridium tertium]MDB1950714.1 hypothetical protein [Clostridium tertium]
MKYVAFIKQVNCDIEEEVTIKIGDIVLTGFANICPYPIEEERSYPVSIGFTILDEFEIVEQQEQKKQFSRIGNTFVYEISGLLTEQGLLDANILIEDEVFEDYSYMYGKYVKFKVDRISLEFLED